jgi:type 1 glutamine amidotransferase
MNTFVNRILLCLLVLLPTTGSKGYAGDKVDWKQVKVLVYTRNGKGYVHDNIPNAVNRIQKLGQQHGFKVDVWDNPSVFTEENLKQYTLLVFPSTNNDVFETDEQRLVFRRYIESGGGLVGIHSVTGTERKWKWFKMMLGGTFAWHARFQKYTIKVIDPDHPSVQGLPKIWEKGDECYFMKEMYPGIHAVLAHDLTTLQENEREKIMTFSIPFTDLYPATWYQHFDGGHIWITALGHDKKDYEDPVFVQHIIQGIQFVAGQVKKTGYSKAYAGSRDEPVRY